MSDITPKQRQTALTILRQREALLHAEFLTLQGRLTELKSSIELLEGRPMGTRLVAVDQPELPEAS